MLKKIIDPFVDFSKKAVALPLSQQFQSIKETNKMKSNKSMCNRLALLQEFEAAPNFTLFGQHTVAAVRDCSLATIERDRWNGNGIPFIKIGRSVRYKKSDILAYLDLHTAYKSTTQAQQLKGEHNV